MTPEQLADLWKKRAEDLRKEMRQMDKTKLQAARMKAMYETLDKCADELTAKLGTPAINPMSHSRVYRDDDEIHDD